MTHPRPATSSPLRALPRPFHRVLVIAAHPDDAEFAFGGTVARLAADGTDVRYVVCTDGSLGSDDPEISGSDLGARRAAEQRAAADLLGVSDVVFLGLPDGTLQPTAPLRKALCRQVRIHKPDLVLTHQPLRSLQFPIGASHPDHLAVGEAAVCAVYPDARNPRAFPELLEQEALDAHSVAEVWVPGHEQANFFVALSQDHADLKLAAILCHESQFERSRSPVDDISWVAERMRHYGPQADSVWAEGFCRIPCGTYAAPKEPQVAPGTQALIPPRLDRT